MSATAPPIVINLSMFLITITASASIQGRSRGSCSLTLNQTGYGSADAGLSCNGGSVSGSISADGAIQGDFGNFGAGVTGGLVGDSATSTQTGEIGGDQVTTTFTATLEPTRYSSAPYADAAGGAVAAGSAALALWWLAKPLCAPAGPVGLVVC